MTLTLTQDLTALGHLRAIELDLKDTYEEAKRQRELHERDVFTRMEAGDGGPEPITSQKVGDTLFVAYQQTFGSVSDTEAFLEWAETHDEELFETKPRKQLISELVRERLDNGEPLPPGLGFYVKDKISQRAG